MAATAIDQTGLVAAVMRRDHCAGLELDPLRVGIYMNLGNAFHVSDRFAEANRAYRNVLELAPQRVGMHAHLAVNLVAQERGAEALAEALREQEEWARLWAVAIIQHAAYRRDESNAALGELIAKYAAASAYQVAEVYGARGEVDLAFAWLERACAQRDAGLAGMKQARTLRALHSDPRWETFLRMMGLAD